MTTEEETQSRGCAAAGVGNLECRKVKSCARRGCAKMPLLAYCCCFILSVGTVRSNIQASSKGVRLLTPGVARGGPGPWVHALRLEGSPLRGEDVEDAVDAAWVAKGLRKPPPGDVMLSLPQMTEASGDDREVITDLFSGSPWALVTVRQYPGGKRHSLSFKPRLGRESGEEREEEEEAFLELEGESEGEGGGGEEGQEEEEALGGGILVRRRTPPFAPRLGRRSPDRGRVVPFSPRLGRRQLRGGPPGEEVQSPASGNPDRNLIFSPRLGRSSLQAMPGSPRSENDGRSRSEESGTKEA